MAKNKQTGFWATNKGKCVRSFGMTLIVYSIIVGLVAICVLAYQITQTAIYLQSPVFAMDFKTLAFLLLLIISSIYFFSRGFDIWNGKLSSQRIAVLSLLTLAFVVLKNALAVSIKADTGEQSGQMIGILDIFLVVYAILYLANWQSAYASYRGKAARQKTPTKNNSKKVHKNNAITVSVIREIYSYCQRMRLQPELTFARENVAHYKALKAVRSVGMWTIDLILLGIIITLFMCFNAVWSMEGWQIAVYVVAILVLGRISLRLYELNGTSNTILVLLTLTILLAPFAMPWFIAIPLLIPIFNALARWDSYKKWFDELGDEVANDNDSITKSGIILKAIASSGEPSAPDDARPKHALEGPQDDGCDDDML